MVLLLDAVQQQGAVHTQALREHVILQVALLQQGEVLLLALLTIWLLMKLSWLAVLQAAEQLGEQQEERHGEQGGCAPVALTLSLAALQLRTFLIWSWAVVRHAEAQAQGVLGVLLAVRA